MAYCPICKKNKVQHDFRPFCSKRCSDVDLAKWMNDNYVISSESLDDEADNSLSRQGDSNLKEKTSS